MSSPYQTKSGSIFVLKSVVPPFEEYVAQLRDIWANRHFTNSGPKHMELKRSLCHFLGVPDCVLLGNGTYALVAALSAFGFEAGEVITTPFTFVASTQCLQPLNLVPRFVDVEPGHLTIDPAAIEAAISEKTRAILGVHVYGNPCDTEAIQKIADRHGLKVIYDAAHAFGVGYKGQSVLNYGDASCLSFHATKAFHTFEGGAVISALPEVCDYVRKYRNFGIAPDGAVVQHGLNTKMSELHAAAGLVNLVHYQELVAARRTLYERYCEALAKVPGLSFVPLTRQENANYNYCPVLFSRGRDALCESLGQAGIFTRKYFYPLVTDMPNFAAYRQHFPVASTIVEQVLCLPIYPDLTFDEQDKVIAIIKNFQSVGTR